MPRVSVVITFLNSGRFLDEAIASVTGQSYTDWELVLVDDGSTDGTRALAERHTGPRVRVLEHAGRRNRGISVSRNLGMRHARGELIALLDSDDVWLPGKLGAQVAVLDLHKEAAMVYSSAERWYTWNGSGLPDRLVRNVERDELVAPPGLLAGYLRDESLAPCTCTALIRRAAFERAAGFCEEFPGLYDDQVFFAKLLLRHPVYVMADATARYRQHDRSTCAVARRDGSGAGARRRFLTWLVQYAEARYPEIQAIAAAELDQVL